MSRAVRPVVLLWFRKESRFPGKGRTGGMRNFFWMISRRSPKKEIYANLLTQGTSYLSLFYQHILSHSVKLRRNHIVLRTLFSQGGIRTKGVIQMNVSCHWSKAAQCSHFPWRWVCQWTTTLRVPELPGDCQLGQNIPKPISWGFSPPGLCVYGRCQCSCTWLFCSLSLADK